MRVPFPTRIPLAYSCTFAVLLCAAQTLEGTPIYFSICTFAFIIIATLTFNLAGGFSRPSGGYVFFYAMLAVIVGLTVKAILREPADSNLHDPQTTMLVYVGGISAMYAAVYMARLVAPKRSLLETMGRNVQWGQASMGCFVIGIAIYLIDLSGPSGAWVSPMNQLNKFLPLGVILGVTHTIRQSGGRRFLSLPVLFICVYMIIIGGILGFSKEAFFTPFLCVLMASGALRFRFSAVQTALFFLAIIFSFHYMVPYMQYGKGRAGGNLSEQIQFSVERLTHLEETRELAGVQGGGYDESGGTFAIHYFNEREGFFDRLEMISVDDALIDITDNGQVFGLLPMLWAVQSVVPHFIWKDKVAVPLGNMYSHEIDHAHGSYVADADETTGISFSPTADAYHEAKWWGVLAVAPIVWFCTFFVLDTLCGDNRKSPWGLLMIALSAHLAPEGMLTGCVYLMTYGAFAIFLASLLAVYVLPIIGTLITGPGKRQFAPIRRSEFVAPVSETQLRGDPTV